MTVLVDAMLNAPLTSTPDENRVLHAVGMAAICQGWPDGPAVGECGAEDLLLIESKGRPVLWPPRVAGLAPYVRCVECHRATGRKAPRSAWVVKP